MNFLVYGLGRSGRAVSQLLVSQGHKVLLYDRQAAPEDLELARQFNLELLSQPTEAAIECCIAAPGVPLEHPDLQRLRDRGIETIGEVEWVYRSFKAEIIGITGTAGKTTVTRWLTDVLQAAGLKAVAGGNIEPALSAVAQDGLLLITELSSFQLERCPTLKPKLAIALNLASDHLDRHGSHEAYFAAKRQIIRNQDANDIFIYNADDPHLAAWAQDHPGKTLGYSLTQKADAWLEPGSGLYLHGEFLLAASELKLPGKHQLANALAVALAAKELGVPLEQLRQGLRTFTGVAGRYALVGTLGNIQFIEDSIATRTLAVKAALEATPAPIVWLAGGVDKGASFTELLPLIAKKVSLMIGIGAAGKSFAAQTQSKTQTLVFSETDGETSLRKACEAAISHLRTFHQGKGTVLLAPLGASFDQFKDYKERALVFKAIVRDLEAAWIPS